MGPQAQPLFGALEARFATGAEALDRSEFAANSGSRPTYSCSPPRDSGLARSTWTCCTCSIVRLFGLATGWACRKLTKPTSICNE